MFYPWLSSPWALWLLAVLPVLTALATPVLGDWIDLLTDDVPDTIMGVSFGIYHLVYAVATWPRRSGRTSLQPGTE